MHLQHSINTLTQNRASSSASGLPRTALLHGFWYGMLGRNNTDTGQLWGTAWPRRWAVKENTLLVALRSAPRLVIPSASGWCCCHHRSLWPLYHQSDVRVFPISWISLDSLCCDINTEKLLCRNTSRALTASVFPCSSHYSTLPVPLKPPYSSAAQLRGCWLHRSPWRHPQAQSQTQAAATMLFTAFIYSTPAKQRLSCATAAWPEIG